LFNCFLPTNYILNSLVAQIFFLMCVNLLWGPLFIPNVGDLCLPFFFLFPFTLIRDLSFHDFHRSISFWFCLFSTVLLFSLHWYLLIITFFCILALVLNFHSFCSFLTAEIRLRSFLFSNIRIYYNFSSKLSFRCIIPILMCYVFI
jgi:sensor histidine kinase YesM